MNNALTNTMSTLPAQLARSLTRDRGKEMSAHAQFKVAARIPVFPDEPTNRLGLPAIEQLERELHGTLLLVSRDRQLLDAMDITRTIGMDNDIAHDISRS